MNRYEFYENTGLDWVPEIPKHWSLTRSKFIFRNKSVKNCPDEPLLSVTQKDGVVLRSESDLNVWNPTEDVSGYKLIEPSNFVISLRSFEGGLELSTVKGIVSPAYTVLEKTRKINDPYFRWLMKSHQFIIELNKHVTGIRQGKNIGWDDFSNIYLTVPPIEEQKLISRYLDKKTRQIDSLVEKIQKKIELLTEQRASLINHYVTKGLDPNVEMKNSGVEWIGVIPKHWGLVKLKYLFSLQAGKDPKSVEIENGKYPIFGTGGEISRADDFLYDKPTLLLGRKGTIDRPFVVSEPFWVSDVMYFTVQKTEVGPDYLSILFNLVPFEFYKYGSTQPSMSRTDYENMKFPIPSSDERKLITKVINRELIKYCALVEKNNSKISLLKEYRQSLISSVVTGKIKVSEDMT